MKKERKGGKQKKTTEREEWDLNRFYARLARSFLPLCT